MRALIASLVFAMAACGPSGKTTTTTTDRVETTDGPGTTTPPDKDPDPELGPKPDITLAEAEQVVSRVVELMALLADSLQVEDCAQIVPNWTEWETTHSAEQMRLEEQGAKIPPEWVNGELVSYYLKMEEHEAAMQNGILTCRCDATVQKTFHLDASKFECP
jgi:hypothetical protein